MVKHLQMFFIFVGWEAEGWVGGVGLKRMKSEHLRWHRARWIFQAKLDCLFAIVFSCWSICFIVRHAFCTFVAFNLWHIFHCRDYFHNLTTRNSVDSGRFHVLPSIVRTECLWSIQLLTIHNSLYIFCTTSLIHAINECITPRWIPHTLSHTCSSLQGVILCTNFTTK